MTRTAILYSGSAYNIRFSIESAMKNLVLPNNADVFIVTERRCLRRKAPAGKIPTISDWVNFERKTSQIVQDLDHPLRDDEIDLIKQTLGGRCKAFYIIDEHADYLQYIYQEREKMRHAMNAYRNESIQLGIKPPFRDEISDADNGNIRCVVDQYRHIKKCYELMVEYENQNNFKYDYVMRARIDFVVPEKISLEWYTLPHDRAYWYIMGSVHRDPFEYCEEFCWFSKRGICDQIYPQLDRMGLLTDRQKYETYYAPQNNDFRFGAETQFALLTKEIGLPWINVKIYRASMFSAGGDGWDYMNYMFSRNRIHIHEEYELACKCDSDINEHVPKLKEYALLCHHVTEFGTRYGNSSIAFLSAQPLKFISYDVTMNDRIEYLKMVAADIPTHFDFRLENVENIEIEETDLLFIDTNHHAEQCSNELRLHAHKVRKYIIFHDTTSFWIRGQGFWTDEGGLKFAIEPFLESHPEWVVDYRAENNNGLMVIKRISDGK